MTPNATHATEASPARGRSTRKTMWIVLTVQSVASMVILLGVLVAGAGIEQRLVLLFGLCLGLGLASALASYLAGRVLSPLDRLAAQAEALVSRTAAMPVPPVGHHSAWIMPDAMLRLADALARLESQAQAGGGQKPPAPQAPVTAGDVHAELQSLKGRLEALSANLPWSFWVTDRQGRITHHNAAAARLLASGAPDLTDRSVQDWVSCHASPAIWSELQHTVQGGARWCGEWDAPSGDGRALRLNITAAPAVDAQGRVQSVIYLAEDVTEVRQLQNLLVDMERLSTRGRMAGEIAHEINNFLTILGGNLDIIPMLLATGHHEKVNAKFAAMRQVLDKIARFSDGLMGQRDHDSEPASCDLNRLIENVVAFLKPQNRYDDIAVCCQLDPNLPKISVRAGEIQQVMVNLLNNAADAVRQRHAHGGRIDIVTRCILAKGEIAICVRDNGPGLSSAASARIFRERFSEKKSGHGLGLLNCYRIAQAHAGSLTVDSAEGQGTAFTLTLPCKEGLGAAEPNASVASPAAG